MEEWMEKKTESKNRGDGKTGVGDRRSAAFVRDFCAQRVQVAFCAAPPDKSPPSSMLLLGFMTPLAPLWLRSQGLFSVYEGVKETLLIGGRCPNCPYYVPFPNWRGSRPLCPYFVPFLGQDIIDTWPPPAFLLDDSFFLQIA